MSPLNRTGESGSVPNRSERFLQKHGYWYYTTREGFDIGPFDDPQDAAHGVDVFIDFIDESEPSVIEKLKLYRLN